MADTATPVRSGPEAGPTLDTKYTQIGRAHV